jgi:hypothetical protein
MTLSDIPLSAIDFHVSSIVEELTTNAAIAAKAQADIFYSPLCLDLTASSVWTRKLNASDMLFCFSRVGGFVMLVLKA